MRHDLHIMIMSKREIHSQDVGQIQLPPSGRPLILTILHPRALYHMHKIGQILLVYVEYTLPLVKFLPQHRITP